MSDPARLFVDSTVLVHATGDEAVTRAAARGLIARVSDGSVSLHASTEAIQELVHHRMRRANRERAVHAAHEILAACVVHAFDHTVLGRALTLIETTRVRGRDAVHAATALQHGFDQIVSSDSDFDGIPGLTRVSPAEAAAALG